MYALLLNVYFFFLLLFFFCEYGNIVHIQQKKKKKKKNLYKISQVIQNKSLIQNKLLQASTGRAGQQDLFFSFAAALQKKST